MRVLLVLLWIFSLTGQTQAENVVSGRIDVPPELLPRVAGAAILSLFGTPISHATANGHYTLPLAPSADVDMLFVRDIHTNDVVLLGYAHDDVVNIGIEGTALAMLLMFNPVNGMLDLNDKKTLLHSFKMNGDFPKLVAAVQKNILSNADVTTTNDHAMTSLLASIQDTTPRPRQNSAMYDPMLLMAR